MGMMNPPAEEAERPLYILSYGMGVESHAIFERWYHDPDSRPFSSWDQLVVLTAQVGEEHTCDTVPNVERRMLPLLREHRVRFVEVARRGPLESDGIVVLQDTREPYRLHPEGAFKLSDELLANGTVPQAAGIHKCALKFKGFVADTWLAHAIRGEAHRPVYHVFGYNAEEGTRAACSEVGLEAKNSDRAVPVRRAAPILVFGFNAEEISRIDRNRLYDGPNRKGLYPLLDWGWTRQNCWDYIFERSGIDWKKSHCSFCPFSQEAAKGLAGAVQRWHSAPEQTAHGLLVEFNALCFNPRGLLYKTKSLLSVVKARDVRPVLDEFERRLAATKWGLYRVRRIYTAVGQAIRCVERLSEGTRHEMNSRFDTVCAGDAPMAVREEHGIRYGMFAYRKDALYPTAEGFYVVAPLFVGTKVRGPIEKFNERWANVVGGREIDARMNEHDCPGQQQLPIETAA